MKTMKTMKTMKKHGVKSLLSILLALCMVMTLTLEVCAEEFFDYARNGDILTGRVTITGKEQFGEFLTANVSDSNNTGTLSYLWTRSSDVGDITTGDTYFVDKRFDANNVITCEVTSSVQTGSIFGYTGTFPMVDAIEPEAFIISGNDDKVTVNVSLADKADLNLNQKATVGDNEVYELSIMSEGKVITDFTGNVAVSLPYIFAIGESSESIVVYSLDTKGAIQVVKNGIYDGKTEFINFMTRHSSYYMVKNKYVNFNDVSDDFWGKAAIDFASARGLVIGVGNNNYNPEGVLTRAQFVQMIQNVLNLPAANNNVSAYWDLDSKLWFYSPIMSAKSAGILNGIKIDGNNFKPNQAITREEMSVILANIAIYKKIYILNEEVDLTKFKDHKDINKDYADKISIAINLGLLNKDGMGGGIFAPKESTTRAQAAQVQINLFKALELAN